MDHLKAVRIAHGVLAAEDQELVEHLAKLQVCPGPSLFRLRVSESQSGRGRPMLLYDFICFYLAFLGGGATNGLCFWSA